MSVSAMTQRSLKHQLPGVSRFPPSKRRKGTLRSSNNGSFKTSQCVFHLQTPHICVADVSQFVSSNKGQRISLKKPESAVLRIAGLEDTVYKDYPIDVNGWGKFYLSKTVTMQVVGVVEGISCPCDQLILMTCEDKRVYAYDEEELHVVASSMKQLRDEGMEYPASETYYNGKAFKNMTKEDWEEVWKGPVGRKLDEEHKKLVATRKPKLLDYLKQKQMLKSC